MKQKNVPDSKHVQRHSIATPLLVALLASGFLTDVATAQEDQVASVPLLSTTESDGEQALLSNKIRAELITKHFKAIDLGLQEYVLNALALHPRYTTGRLSKLSREEKEIKAQESYYFFVENYFSGIPTNKESYEEFATYNPSLAEYLVIFGDDFNIEVVGNLKSTIELLAAKRELAQSQAELAQSQAELAQSQAELRAAFGELAEVMKSKGMGN